jgi:subtilisin family serine protease
VHAAGIDAAASQIAPFPTTRRLLLAVGRLALVGIQFSVYTKTFVPRLSEGRLMARTKASAGVFALPAGLPAKDPMPGTMASRDKTGHVSLNQAPSWPNPSEVSHSASASASNPLSLVGLPELMRLSDGRRDIGVGLIDGPVAVWIKEFEDTPIRQASSKAFGNCRNVNSAACKHGTFVAGILSAGRTSIAPALCPGSLLILRPIFSEEEEVPGGQPSANPRELANAIVDTIEAGARVINLSAALESSTPDSEKELEDSLTFAASRGVIVVAASGNFGSVGGTVITRHPSVLPVVAYDLAGRPTDESTLGSSIGLRGLGAPGEGVESLSADGQPSRLDGTSVAAPFVTGSVALLWSIFPRLTASEIRWALTTGSQPRRRSVLPPLLNAWASYEILRSLGQRSGP